MENRLAGKKVLVTGAGGFIGSHVTELLLSKDCLVNAFFHYNSRNSLGHLQGLKSDKLTPFFGDLADEDSVETASKGMDYIINIAAMISVPYSIQNPRSAVLANITGSMNILQAARNSPTCKRVIITSSSEVYGSADSIPIKELDLPKPQSPYAASKVAADALAYSYFTSYETPVVILRPFNTFGPRQSDRAVIPSIIKQALWKDKIEVGMLTTKRDYVFVTDTAQAFVDALTAPDNVLGKTIHFGTGVAYSVQQVIDTVKKLLDCPNKEVVSTPFRMRPNQSEVTHLEADPTRAELVLNWKPSVSFEQGIQRTIDYIWNNQAAYSAGYNV